MRLLVCSLTLALSGCGLLVGSVHCDFDDHDRCQERIDTTAAVAFKGTCSAAQGKPGDGPCRTEKKVGGCDLGKQGDGSQITDWYYEPRTRADAMSKCDSDEPFVEP